MQGIHIRIGFLGIPKNVIDRAGARPARAPGECMPTLAEQLAPTRARNCVQHLTVERYCAMSLVSNPVLAERFSGCMSFIFGLG